MLKRAFLFPVFFCAFLQAPPVFAEFIIGSGCSVSNAGYLRDLAKKYEQRTGAKVFVRGGGSVVGIEDLRSRKADFAASCRGREASDPEDLEFIQVAWDALVFIVHPSNPLENISLDAVRGIYAARTMNWKQLGGRNAPIKLFISRPRKGLSGVEALTNKMVLKGREPAKTPHTLFLASTGIVEEMVESTPDGFATTGFSSARKKGVKMLKVNGIQPSKKNIQNNVYPFRRPLYLIVPKNPKPDVRKFIDFALGNEGQEFIDSMGAVSLRSVK